nr:MAG TPA: hypothetical protein [Caudoviricetes sp.]
MFFLFHAFFLLILRLTITTHIFYNAPYSLSSKSTHQLDAKNLGLLL